MRRAGKPKRFPWGIILSLVVAPWGWGPPNGLLPPSPEPQVTHGQQLTEPNAELGSRGTLLTGDGEVSCVFKSVGNTNNSWTTNP